MERMAIASSSSVCESMGGGTDEKDVDLSSVISDVFKVIVGLELSSHAEKIKDIYTQLNGDVSKQIEVCLAVTFLTSCVFCYKGLNRSNNLIMQNLESKRCNPKCSV